MRRPLALIAVTLAIAVAATLSATAVGAAPVAVAQTDETTTTVPAPEAPSIIPEPNSGHAPTEAGDRGGALQTALFAAMIGGVILIGVLVVRESRKARARRGF